MTLSPDLIKEVVDEYVAQVDPESKSEFIRQRKAYEKSVMMLLNDKLAGYSR